MCITKAVPTPNLPKTAKHQHDLHQNPRKSIDLS